MKVKDFTDAYDILVNQEKEIIKLKLAELEEQQADDAAKISHVKQIIKRYHGHSPFTKEYLRIVPKY